jgi:ATP phosphoribosyltransferase regulatory subunit HisZ
MADGERLKERFAAAALTGLCANPDQFLQEGYIEEMALLAWQFGAAMVAYRGEAERIRQDELNDQRLSEAESGAAEGNRVDGRQVRTRAPVDP